ncbi:MAG: TIR domain-containing protein [Rhizomicrobium sp.]|jgi:adenylate cyclase
MPDIFLSYSREDQATARRFADAFEAQGFSVWWDVTLRSGEAYDQVTEKALRDAHAVVVLWSKKSVESQWVRAEATLGHRSKKLAPAMIEACERPIMFELTQAADLCHWSGDPLDTAWTAFLADVKRFVKTQTAVAENSLSPVRNAGNDLRGERPEAPRTPAICVLPFANMSDDPQQEYFSDGISEDIITDLSKVSALAVISRNSAFQYKGKYIDLPKVARELKVSHVLEGSVRKAGGRVRITAQLIDGATNDHIWAERYDRDLSDIFALQDEISEAIVKALKLRLLPEEKKAIERRGTDNVDAYNLYLMARQYSLMANSRHRDIIVRLCRRALELDPNYAKAWALLAISLSNLVLLNRRVGENGWDAAEKALSLEPDLAEAHAARGRVLGDNGRNEDAIAEHEKAIRLDPESYEVNAAAARSFLSARRFAEAAACLDKASMLAENDFWSTGMAMQAHRGAGDTQGERRAAQCTLERVEKALAIEPDHGNAMSFGVTALIALGEKERAIEWTERAILLDPDNINMRYNLACGMFQLGEIERGLDYLETVIAGTVRQGVNWMVLDNDLDPVRDHPRFKAMIAAAEARLAPEGAATGSPTSS